MADVTSREKAVYWVLIVLVALAGGGALAYFFVTGQQSGTSLTGTSVGTNATGNGSVDAYSLIDIVSPNQPTANDKGQPAPVPGNNKPTQPPIIIGNNSTNQVPAPGNNTTNQVPVPPTNRVNTPVVAANNRVNQVLTADPLNTNDFLNRPVVTNGTTTTGSLASGSAIPDNAPTTGVEVLVLSGIASLGISGAASALALRKPKGRSRKTRS